MSFIIELVFIVAVFLAFPNATKAQSPEIISMSTIPDTNAIIQQIKDVNVLSNKSPDSAILVFYRILEQSQVANFGRGIRNAWLRLMILYHNDGQYEKGIDASYALIDAADSVRNIDVFYYAYYWRALCLHKLSQPDAALDAYRQVLHFAPDSSHKERILIYSNMGELMYRLDQPKKALSYFNKAIQEGQISGLSDAIAMAHPYVNMALSYVSLGKFEMADSFFARAYRIANLHDDKKSLYVIKRMQLPMYNQRDLPKKTLATIQDARNLLRDTQLFNGERVLIHQLDLFAGQAYLQLEQYRNAEAALQIALHTADSVHYADRSIAYGLLSRLYDSLGNYKLAYRYLLMRNEEHFKVANKDIQARFNESEIRFRTAEKEKEIAEKNLLLSESEKNIAQKNLLIVSLFSGGFLLCLVFLWLYFSLRRKQKMNRQQQEIEHLKSMMKGEESERIRLARELHDGIGGMLTAIKMNAGSLRKAYPETAQDKLETLTKMLADTSAEVRTTAHNLMPDALTRYGLHEAITQYIGKINESSTIEVELHTPNASSLQLEKPVELILYRMVQELIQNVIKHAEATHIVLQLLQHNGQLTLTVEDNGRGFDPAQASGFGLENLKYRVQALHGELETDSQPGRGTTIRILFDVEKLHEIST